MPGRAGPPPAQYYTFRQSIINNNNTRTQTRDTDTTTIDKYRESSSRGGEEVIFRLTH